MLDNAVCAGAELVTGGRCEETGFFIEPTILTNVVARAAIAQREVFGPVLTVITFDDEAEAVALANDTLLVSPEPFGPAMLYARTVFPPQCALAPSG